MLRRYYIDDNKIKIRHCGEFRVEGSSCLNRMIKIIKISNTTVEIINLISTVILVTMSIVASTLYDNDKH